MTEAEWLACDDPPLMLMCVVSTASIRKMRLVACACCRRIWHLFTLKRHEPCRRAVELVEAVADGKVSELRLPPAWQEARAVSAPFTAAHHLHAAALTTCKMPDSLAEVMSHAASATRNGTLERLEQCRILRDIFGTPFRPVAFAPEWRTDTAVALARTMYASREFSAMPILADALQDAGCDNDDVLSHCRMPGGGSGEPAGGSPVQATHVRGCWVVDAVLGNK